MLVYVMGRGKPKEVANVAWAFGKVGIKGEIFFEAVERKSEFLVMEGSVRLGMLLIL